MELSSAASNGVFVCLWVLAKVWLMQGETFCRIQSAQPMMDTRLICFFAEDLRLTKKDFAVFHYVPNQQQDKVVDCHWMEGEMYCSLEPGYEYVQTATSNFSVRIRHVSGKHVGLYECRLNGANGSDVRQCKFTLKPGPCVLELVTSDWMLSSVCNFTGRTQVTDATTCTWLSRQGKEGSALLVDISTGAVFGKTCFFSSILRSDKDGVYSFTVQLTNGLQYETNSVSIGRPSDVYTTCPRYVAEGESVRCECSVRHPGYPPALATWDADGAESTLRKLRVRREEDSTVLGTCYVVWPNHNYPPLHQLTYILRVAYGPEKSKMAIEGPRDVFADGSRKMALTCKVDDVNPAPEITWSGVTCEERAAPGQCVFVTDPAADREIVVSCTATNVHNNGRLATASLVINLNVTLLQQQEDKVPPVISITTIGIFVFSALIVMAVIVITCVYIMRHKERVQHLRLSPGGAVSDQTTESVTYSHIASDVQPAMYRHIASDLQGGPQEGAEGNLYEEIPSMLHSAYDTTKGNKVIQSGTLNTDSRHKGEEQGGASSSPDYLHPLNDNTG